MENEVNLERTYETTPERMWDAWTKPQELQQWWGPDNVTIPVCEVDLRIGGTIHIVMEAGEAMGPYKGALWPMQGEFTAIEPLSRLSFAANAWTEGAKEDTTIEQTTDIAFSEEDGKTKVTIKAIIHKAGPKAQMAVQGMQMGFTQQLEKLAVYLATHAS